MAIKWQSHDHGWTANTEADYHVPVSLNKICEKQDKKGCSGKAIPSKDHKAGWWLSKLSFLVKNNLNAQHPG